MEEEIIGLWEQGMMIEEISDELGCSESRVYETLINEGLIECD